MNGKQKRRKREVPPGLTKQEAKILRKVRSRAHYLDKGFNLCGLRFGWTFLIGLIPVAGDLTDAFLNHQLVVKKAQQIEGIPDWLIHRMVMNNSVSLGLGFVPLVGDIALAAWKSNWRNADLLEKYLRERGAANVGHSGGAAGTSAAGTSSAVGGTSAQAPPVPQRPVH